MKNWKKNAPKGWRGSQNEALGNHALDSKAHLKTQGGHSKSGARNLNIHRGLWLGLLPLALLFWSGWQFAKTDIGFFPQDDAYIALQFAKELFKSWTFAYNHGEPSAGLTSPLHVIVVAVVQLFTRDWYLASVLVGGMSYLLLFGLGTLFCRRFFGWPAAFAYAAFLAVNGRLMYLSLIGLESVAFAGFIMLLAYGYHAWPKPGVAGFLLGLCCLCRPDGIFALPALMMLYGRRRQWRRLVIDAIFFAITVGPWVLFCMAQNGTPFPNTVIAKSVSGITGEMRWDFLKSVAFLSTNDGMYERMVSHYAGTSVWEVIRQYLPVFIGSTLVIFIAPSYLMIPVGTALVHTAVLCLKHPGAAEWQRYLSLEHGVFALALGIGLGRAFEWAKNQLGVRLAHFTSAGVLVGLIGIFAQDVAWQARARAVISRYFYSLDYRTGLWLAEHAPRDSRVGLYQAGGVKFFSGLYAIDFGELMYPALSDYKKPRHGFQALLDYRVDYLAEFGRDWLDAWGISDTEDRRFFEPVVEFDYQGRGLVHVDQVAILQYVRKI